MTNEEQAVIEAARAVVTAMDSGQGPSHHHALQHAVYDLDAAEPQRRKILVAYVATDAIGNTVVGRAQATLPAGLVISLPAVEAWEKALAADNGTHNLRTTAYFELES